MTDFILVAGMVIIFIFLVWGLYKDVKNQTLKKANWKAIKNPKVGNTSSKASWVIFCSLIGAIFVFTASSGNALQATSGAAFGLCMAVIPYILFKVGYCVRMERYQLDILNALNKPDKLESPE